MNPGGLWRNEYGSLMRLNEGKDGLLTGVYASTTGSTGTYPAQGWVGREPNDKDSGRPISLVLSWRSLDGGKGDPSWHWVSGLSGQIVGDARGQPTLLLNHGLVATEPFPGSVDTGILIDKLVYEPAPAEAAAALARAPAWPTAPSEQFSGGKWQDQAAQVVLALDRGLSSIGAVTGSLRRHGREARCIGFIDRHAAETSTGLQAVAIAFGAADANETGTLFGYRHLDSGRLTLTSLLSRGTRRNATYLQTSLDQLLLDPA